MSLLMVVWLLAATAVVVAAEKMEQTTGHGFVLPGSFSWLLDGVPANIMREELMKFFPVEAGFTWWYEVPSGEIIKVILTGVRPDGNEVVYQLISGNSRLEYRIKENEVQETFFGGTMLSAEMNPLAIMQYPLDHSQQWVQMSSKPFTVVANVLEGAMDPSDHLKTVRIRYQLTEWETLRILRSKERVYKAGLGMVLEEDQLEKGKPVQTYILKKTQPAYLFVSEKNGITAFVDMSRILWIHEPNGPKIADVWVKRIVDDRGRKALIDGRYGDGENVEGFDRLAYYIQHVWLKMEDPAYPAGLRKIAQETYYDRYGQVIDSVTMADTWRGGKWFTVPGFEGIIDILTSR